jgi:acyl carrier protein
VESQSWGRLSLPNIRPQLALVMEAKEAELEDRLKVLIVETLGLEDVEPASIKNDEPLFGEGLGLDSIDALEMAIAINSEFGVRTEENDENNRTYYTSINTLAAFIREKQAAAGSTASGDAS